MPDWYVRCGGGAVDEAQAVQAEDGFVSDAWPLPVGMVARPEELLVERNVEVDHVTILRWVVRFTLLADAGRFARHAPGDRWFVDESYVKVNGVWRYVYRAIDQYGQIIGDGTGWNAYVV
jgi:DDE domain